MGESANERGNGLRCRAATLLRRAINHESSRDGGGGGTEINRRRWVGCRLYDTTHQCVHIQQATIPLSPTQTQDSIGGGIDD